MNLSWDNVSSFFEEEKVWVHDAELHWYRQAWELMESNFLTVANSTAEKLAVYSRIYALIAIYKEFCSIAAQETSEVYVSFPLDDIVEDMALESEYKEDVLDILQECVCNEDAKATIFALFKEKINKNTFFASLWYSVYPNELETPLDTYNEYLEALSKIVNYDLSADKLAAYEWLDNNL